MRVAGWIVVDESQVSVTTEVESGVLCSNSQLINWYVYNFGQARGDAFFVLLGEFQSLYGEE